MLQHFRLSENVGDGKERVAWDLFTESYDLVGLLGQSLEDKLYFNKEGIQGADPGGGSMVGSREGVVPGGSGPSSPFLGDPQTSQRGEKRCFCVFFMGGANHYLDPSILKSYILPGLRPHFGGPL